MVALDRPMKRPRTGGKPPATRELKSTKVDGDLLSKAAILARDQKLTQAEFLSRLLEEPIEARWLAYVERTNLAKPKTRSHSD